VQLIITYVLKSDFCFTRKQNVSTCLRSNLLGRQEIAREIKSIRKTRNRTRGQINQIKLFLGIIIILIHCWLPSRRGIRLYSYRNMRKMSFYLQHHRIYFSLFHPLQLHRNSSRNFCSLRSRNKEHHSVHKKLILHHQTNHRIASPHSTSWYTKYG
jgi:hypothetical protein